MSDLLSIKDVSEIPKVAQIAIRQVLARSELRGIEVRRLWRIPQTEIDRLSGIVECKEHAGNLKA